MADDEGDTTLVHSEETEQHTTLIQQVNRDLEIYVSLPSVDKRLFVDVHEQFEQSPPKKKSKKSKTDDTNTTSKSKKSKKHGTRSSKRKQTQNEEADETMADCEDNSNAVLEKHHKRTKFDNVKLRVRVAPPTNEESNKKKRKTNNAEPLATVRLVNQYQPPQRECH